MACILAPQWSKTATVTAPQKAFGSTVGRVMSKVAKTRRLGQSLCGYQDAPALAPWQPGDTGRIVLTVSNSNAVLDDGWDFFINGVFACNYDGGGDTTISFSTDAPPDQVWELTAECVSEQNDNYFEITVTVDGVAVIETYIDGDGEVGETRNLGTFNT